MPTSFTHHHIVCGFDAVGRAVARELRTAGAHCVVIDDSADSGGAASILGLPFVLGSAADPEHLQAAGIAHARSLIACDDSEAANAITVRAARELRADLPIVARATGDGSEQGLRQSGAGRVPPLERVGGVELARLAMHPSTGEQQEAGHDYRVTEISVGLDGAGSGHAIGAVRGAAFVVGLQRANGWFVPLPPDDTVLRPGDRIMTLGTPATIELLERLMLTRDSYAPAETLGLPRTSRRL